MNRRFRFLAALLALVGYAALFAENLVAMSCVAAEASADSELHAGMHPPDPGPSDPDRDDPAPPQCPLAMAGGSCMASVTLPAVSSHGRTPEPAGQAAPISVRDVADELVVRPLFHPPKS